MTTLNNPGLAGVFSFDTVIYASSGLNYSAVPVLAQYNIYDSPDPAYVTARINISVFAEVGASVPWPFSNMDAPLNGHVCVPHGRGPFPLAVFAHGNHNPYENSTPGYLYLCQLLASHGIIAATIDVNFLNGFNFGENDGRAIVHLEHIKQFRTWDSTQAHPLHGKIDLNRILIVGHSRGGEGVGHASFFNRLTSIKPDIFGPVVLLDGSAGLGPYRFGLTAAAAIAPTDRQYQPLSGPTVVPDTYFLIHGSRDGDVSTFEGYNTYNRAHAVDVANPTVSDGKLKALLWAYGANHNQFNTVWLSETPPAITMARPDQEQIAKIHLGALAQALLLDRPDYLNVLRDHAIADMWEPPGIDLVSQYQDAERIFLQHEQEGVAPPQISLPVQGTVAADAVIATRQLIDLVNSGAPLVRPYPVEVATSPTTYISVTTHISRPGLSCLALEEVSPPRKQIISSRSFGQPVQALSDLSEALAEHLATPYTRYPLNTAFRNAGAYHPLPPLTVINTIAPRILASFCAPG